MTPEEFWYDDEDYLIAYRKAYLNKLSKQGWINGRYILEAMYEVSTTINPRLMYNAFSAFNPQDIEVLPYRNEPIDFLNVEGQKETKEKKTEKDIEQEYRDRLNFWV